LDWCPSHDARVGVAGSDGEFTFLVERTYCFMVVPGGMWGSFPGFYPGESAGSYSMRSIREGAHSSN
jgi:hypothetical protein